MRLLKRPLLLLLGLSLLFLCGCMKAQRLRERAVVQSVGVDMVDGRYLLTLVYFSPNAQALPTGAETAVASGSGATLSQAVDNASQSTGRQMFFGSTRVILLGEAFAVQGIAPAINYFNANSQLHPATYLLVCEQSAAPAAKHVDPETLAALAAATRARQGGVGGRLMDAVADLETPAAALCLPLLQKNAQGDEYSLKAGALLRGGKLTAPLSERSFTALGWLLGDMAGTTLTAPMPSGGLCTFSVQQSRPKITPREQENGRLVFDVAINATAALNEVLPRPEAGITDALLKEAQSALKSELLDLTGVALQETAYENAADLCHFYALLKKHLPTKLPQNKEEMQKLLQNSAFEIKINVQISRTGLETPSKTR